MYKIQPGKKEYVVLHYMDDQLKKTNSTDQNPTQKTVSKASAIMARTFVIAVPVVWHATIIITCENV